MRQLKAELRQVSQERGKLSDQVQVLQAKNAQVMQPVKGSGPAGSPPLELSVIAETLCKELVMIFPHLSSP